MQPLESAGEFISIARYDWLEVVGTGDDDLHAVRDETWTDEHRDDMAHEWAVLSPVRLACGKLAASAWIPGVGARLDAPRCAGCCEALGYPLGVGSPKNSDGCRAILGLPADGGPAAVAAGGAA